jgi:hypothetical protein
MANEFSAVTQDVDAYDQRCQEAYRVFVDSTFKTYETVLQNEILFVRNIQSTKITVTFRKKETNRLE